MATGALRSFSVQPPGFSPFPPPVTQDSRDEEEDVTSEPEDSDPGQVSLSPGPVDMTRQLLRFADLISSDVQRYFGPGDVDSPETPVDSPETGGRSRYYDDLLRLAKAGSPVQREAAAADAGLGPLAELFDQKGPPSQGPPMNRRHLPLSFWAEPSPGSLQDRHTTEAPAETDTHLLCSPLSCHNTQPDFSDLLAHWDPHPELCHAHLVQ